MHRRAGAGLLQVPARAVGGPGRGGRHLRRLAVPRRPRPVLRGVGPRASTRRRQTTVNYVGLPRRHRRRRVGLPGDHGAAPDLDLPLVVVLDRAGSPLPSAAEPFLAPLNLVDGQVDTNAFDNDVQVLGVPLSVLPLVQGRVSFGVQAVSADGTVDDVGTTTVPDRGRAQHPHELRPAGSRTDAHRARTAGWRCCCRPPTARRSPSPRTRRPTPRTSPSAGTRAPWWCCRTTTRRPGGASRCRSRCRRWSDRPAGRAQPVG